MLLKCTEMVFEDVVDALIDLNKQNRERLKYLNASYCPLEYIKELGTIHLNMGRAVGKTRYIKTHANPNDLILTHGKDYNNTGWCGEKARTEHIVSTDKMQIDYFNHWKKRHDIIWIDEPRLVFRNIPLESVMMELIKDYDQTVIMLGE